MQTKHRGLGPAFSCALLGLTACTTPTVLSHSAIDYNAAIADAADSQLLLNIMRAAYRNPTHYSAISHVLDSRSVSGAASVSGSLPFGPDATFGNVLSPSLSTTGSLAPSFDVAPLDTSSAAKGLFHPLDPQVPLTYWQQNWPGMVLLFLFVDDAIVNAPLQRYCHLYDRRIVNHRLDNAAYDLRQFRLARRLFECIAPHMHFEVVDLATPVLTRTPVPPATVLQSLPDLEKSNFEVKEVTTARGHKLYSVNRTARVLKLVLKFNAKSSTIQMTNHKSRAEVIKNPLPAVTFDIRSVDGIVYYLGELIRLQKRYGRAMRFTPRYALKRNDHSVRDTLFDVQVDASGDAADSVAVDFLGHRYSISRIPHQHDRSLTALALLEQVFALYREEQDLPKTSAVQVVGVR